MKKVIIVRGIPGSGKSTYARKIATEKNLNETLNIFNADSFFEFTGIRQESLLDLSAG